MPKFPGFPRQTLSFLRALETHNDKEWLDAHRSDYEAYWIGPARAFVEAMGARLQTIAPVQAVPRVDGSIFRINRDVRFTSDKRPYKAYLDLWFWEGGERNEGTSGFYVRLSPKSLALGAGNRAFPRGQLLEYRAAAADETSGQELQRIATKLEKAGYSLEGQHYARAPRGLAPDHPRADLLRHGALYSGVTLTPPPPEVCGPALVGLCARHFARLLPLHRWLFDHTSPI